MHLGKDFRLPYIYVNATSDDWSLLNQRADILWARSDRHCHYQMLSSHLKTATDQHLEQVAIVMLLSNNNTHVTSEGVIVTRLWWTPSDSLACLRKWPQTCALITLTNCPNRLALNPTIASNSSHTARTVDVLSLWQRCRPIRDVFQQWVFCWLIFLVRFVRPNVIGDWLKRTSSGKPSKSSKIAFC